VAYVANPGVFYIGMQDQWFTFNIFDAQAWWARGVIMGRIALPDPAAMQADVANRIAREDTIEGDYGRIWYQGGYVKEPIDKMDYPSFTLKARVWPSRNGRVTRNRAL
jgi:trimethylamine monooxygenase